MPAGKAELEITKVGNLMGAEFNVSDASAKIPAEDIRRLSGRDCRLHIVYADRTIKTKWGKGDADKIPR